MNLSRDAVSGEVRAAMGRANVTQRNLAANIGMSDQALSARLSGGKAFNLDELAAIAGVLEVDVLDFLNPPRREVVA